MNIKDHFLTKETFRIERDEKTGVLATRPIPGNLSGYYEAQDYRSHGSQQKGLIDYVYSAAKALRTKSKRKLIYTYDSKKECEKFYKSIILHAKNFKRIKGSQI